MQNKRMGQKLFFIVLCVVFIAGCAKDAQPTTTLPSVDQTRSVKDVETQPVPSSTATTAPTKTSEPTATPTTRPLQPVPMTAENAQNIQLITTHEFFSLGALDQAKWSPDGETLIVVTDRDLQIVDAQSLEIVHSIPDHTFIQFLQDGNVLLSNQYELPVILDMQSAELSLTDVAVPVGYNSSAFAVSSDGKVVADASTENIIKLIDLDSGDIKEFPYHLRDYAKVRPLAVTFSPDQMYLYVLNYIQMDLYEILVFDLARQQLHSQHPGFWRLPEFTPDGRRLVFEKGKYVSLFTTVLGPWSNHAAWFSASLNDDEEIYYNETAYAFIEDSTKIAVLYQGEITNDVKDEQRYTATIIIYDTGKGSVDRFINDVPANSFDIGFSPDGSEFFTLTNDGLIQIWDASTNELLRTSQSYQPNSYLQVSPDGMLLAYIKGDRVQIVNIADGEIVVNFTASNPSFVTFQGNDVFAISGNNQTDTYAIQSGEWIRSYPELTYCAFNQTGIIMACSGMDLKLFDAKTGRTLLQFRPAESSYHFAVSDDGAYTAYCNLRSETVFLWDTQRGEQLQFLRMSQNQPACGSLDFSADGQLLVSSTGAVWEIPTGDLILEMPIQKAENVTWRTLRKVDIAPNNEIVMIYPQIYRLSDGALLKEMDSEELIDAWFHSDGFNLFLLSESELQTWGVLE